MKNSYVIKSLSGTAFIFALIFLCAGKLNYYQGLTYCAIGLIMIILQLTVLRPDEELIDERSKPAANTQNWDKTILKILFPVQLSLYITGSLDSGRFGWSPDFPFSLFIIGILLTFSGQLIFLIAQKQNKFFSSTVRIQSERGHSVCQSGLYKFVRHPAYFGSMVQLCGFPLLFGSLYSILPAFLLIVLLMVRTQLEDHFLLHHLPGYPEYSRKTKYRLIPLIY